MTGRVRAAAVAAAMVLVVTSCSPGSESSPPDVARIAEIGDTAKVVDGERTVVRSTTGVTIEVPAGYATGGTLAIVEDTPAEVDLEEVNLRNGGDPVEVTLVGGDLTGEATVTFPLDTDVDAGRFPIVERLTTGTGRWEPEPFANLDYGQASITVTVEHFSWYRPSWLSVDKVAERFRQLWLAVFGDGLAGAKRPTCPRDGETLASVAWDSSPDDSLFWCIGTNEDGTVILNVVNNNRYPMALVTTSNMTDISKWGGSWLTTANLGAKIDEWGSGQVVLEAREGVTFTLDDGIDGTYQLRSDFTLFTWAVAMLGVSLNTYVDIWTNAGGDVETITEKMAFAASSTGCMGALIDKIVNDESTFGPARTVLVEAMGCAGDVFEEAISDSGLLARIGGTVVSFVTGPVIAAFEGLVALTELGYDSVRRRATYDLDFQPTVKTDQSLDCNFGPAGVPLGHPNQFDVVAQCFYNAWLAGDRGAAAPFAEPGAIEVLFEVSPAGGPSWEYQGCNTGPESQGSWGQTTCTYVEPAPPGELHGVGIVFLYTAYDDVLVIGDIQING